MRRLGVQYYKTPDLELVLGPEPETVPLSAEPVLVHEPDAPKERSRLPKLYDHPSLRWPTGERPKIVVEDK